MVIEYTGRQTVVTQKYKDLAAAGLKRIDKMVGERATAHVVLTAVKYRMIAEVTVTQGGQSMVSNCESAEMTTALRDALAKWSRRSSARGRGVHKRHPKDGGERATAQVVLTEVKYRMIAEVKVTEGGKEAWCEN